MAAATTFEIGADLSTCATLTSIGIVEPASQFSEFYETVKLSNGLMRGFGSYQAEWYFQFLYKSQYDLLRGFCSSAGTSVCIATLNSDKEWVRYNCNMEVPITWKIRKDNANSKAIYQDVVVKFTNMTEAE